MRTIAFLLVFMGLAAGAWAGGVGDAVEVRIRSDYGVDLPLYPVSARWPNRKVYAEAVRGDHYSIVVHNRLNRRVGIVVAVDGRNIISGKKSWLGKDERMYILEPYGAGEYKGWRTGDDRVNRFFFTAAADSYSAAFNDESAMGVIAVAVYPEVQRGADAEIPPAALGWGARVLEKKAAPAPRAREESAGTGYGREEYSPVRIVEFEPERTALEKIYVRYEWRETLCRKGIIACWKPLPRPYNRMWDDDGYAPPPPGRY